jgi:hypothetical protein
LVVLDICSSSANTITDLFDQLHQNNEIRFLWISSVNVLFTTLIQLSAEMRTANPILAVDALRRFDVARDCLRSLAEYWLNAEIILRLFEESSERLQQELKIGKARKFPHGNGTNTETLDSSATGPDEGEGGGGDDLSNIDWRDLYSYNQDALQTAEGQNANVDWGDQYWDNAGFSLLDAFDSFPP